MATVNIRRDVTDPFYRYKMEKIQAKIEGKGNGIKTVIVNLSSVAQSLARPAPYVLKYFGMELGAQTKENDNDRWIINGAHEASKLQDYLDGFINKFVLCRKCKNPETTIHIKNETITLDCKACGEQSEVERGLKFSAKLIQEAGKQGKKDKSSKKADRKARKEAGSNGMHATAPNGHGSPGDSNDEDADGDVGIEAGSDDEFTQQIQKDAAQIDDAEPKEIQWSLDTSEEAVKARANLANDLQKNLNLDDDEEGEGENAYDTFGSWIIDTAKEKGGVDKLDDVDVFLKAKDLGIEKKHKTVQVLAQTIFDKNIAKQIDARASMLKKMIGDSEKHEKALLGGTERFVGKEHPELIPQVSVILIKYYQNDLISEETAKNWGTKASKKYVDLATSKKVRKSAEKFLQWLEEAESESEDEESDEE